MRMDDLILVSVDDHAVEPPDLFEGRLPQKYVDEAPRLVRKDGGTHPIDVWQFQGLELPNIGLNAVAAPVRGTDGQVSAAVSVAGPSYRVTPQRLTELGEMTKEAGEAISQRMGYIATGGGQA